MDGPRARAIQSPARGPLDARVSRPPVACSWRGAYVPRVSLLAPTPPDHLVDERGRPYFLWDLDMTLEELRRRLEDSDDDTRAYFLGKVMRQAKPDDVLSLVSADRIARDWDRVQRHLGNQRSFWAWLLGKWRSMGYVAG